MIIKNKAELSQTIYRRAVLDIIEAGIARVLPFEVMQTAVSFDHCQNTLKINGDIFPVDRGRIFIIGGGKASGMMAQALEKILGLEIITDGLVISKSDNLNTLKIKVITAGHPIPDERGLEGVNRMLLLKDIYSIGEDDLVLCLISGGGSALMPCPVDGISLQDKQLVTKMLLTSGADINEINTVRKHLSRIKGGRLGLHFSPARVISLILSDVIGNDLSIIASGPTVPDPSTFSDAYQVLEKYNLLPQVPASILDYLQKGCLGAEEETPKILDNCRNYIIGDNKLALDAMAKRASDIGYHPFIITTEQKGETSEVAHFRARQVMSMDKSKHNIFLLGGETTLQVPESAGKGGRNQHYALASLIAMKDYSGDWVIASVGSDGTDYLPDVAGAIVDNNSLDILNKNNIDPRYYLYGYDSHTLLAKLGNALIITGNTGTNVCDLIVYLIK